MILLFLGRTLCPVTGPSFKSGQVSRSSSAILYIVGFAFAGSWPSGVQPRNTYRPDAPISVAISDIVSDEDVPAELQQDPELWSGCISGAYREDEFLAAFESRELTPMERFSLMEILIQCADDVHGSERFDTYCARLETILIRQFAWHCETVRYWAQLDREDAGDVGREVLDVGQAQQARRLGYVEVGAVRRESGRDRGHGVLVLGVVLGGVEQRRGERGVGGAVGGVGVTGEAVAVPGVGEGHALVRPADAIGQVLAVGLAGGVGILDQRRIAVEADPRLKTVSLRQQLALDIGNATHAVLLPRRIGTRPHDGRADQVLAVGGEDLDVVLGADDAIDRDGRHRSSGETEQFEARKSYAAVPAAPEP